MNIDMDKNEERLMWINKVNKLQEDINNAKGGK